MMVFPHFLALASLVHTDGDIMLTGDHRQLAPILAHDWEHEDSPVMDALVYSDMTTGPAGQRLTFEARIAEIVERYPAGHTVRRAISRSRPTLAAAVDRTTRQLASVGYPM